MRTPDYRRIGLGKDHLIFHLTSALGLAQYFSGLRFNNKIRLV